MRFSQISLRQADEPLRDIRQQDLSKFQQLTFSVYDNLYYKTFMQAIECFNSDYGDLVVAQAI